MNDSGTQIIRCKSCGAANRIPADRMSMTAKCGKCHEVLSLQKSDGFPDPSYTMRCTECRAKNRIPSGKLNASAKCGKCSSILKTDELFTPQPIMISDGNFESMVLKSPLPVLMWAWAPW